MWRDQIGYLVPTGDGHFFVRCIRCQKQVGENVSLTPVFDINIKPYNQHCCDCAAHLIVGIKSFPELFDGR